MQERSVTIAGHNYKLDLPYFVLATQNPIEQEGTYPLPEAQLEVYGRTYRKTFINFFTASVFVHKQARQGRQCRRCLRTQDAKHTGIES